MWREFSGGKPAFLTEHSASCSSLFTSPGTYATAQANAWCLRLMTDYESGQTPTATKTPSLRLLRSRHLQHRLGSLFSLGPAVVVSLLRLAVTKLSADFRLPGHGGRLVSSPSIPWLHRGSREEIVFCSRNPMLCVNIIT